MVFINNVMWIIESVVVVNIVINLFTNNSVMSLVISCMILGSCELMRYITSNPNQKSQRQYWWQRADCDYWLCDGSTCSNVNCDDIPFVDNLDCGDIGDGCEGITDIGCDGINEIGCESLSEIGCESIGELGCKAVEGCDCDL